MSTSIKGATVVNTIGLLRELVGRDTLNMLIEYSPPEVQQLIRRTIIAIEWVPADLWALFLEVLLKHLAHQDEIKFRKILRAICKRDFTSQYRAYIQGASVLELIDKLPTVWSAYFNSGALSVGSLVSTNNNYSISLRLSDFHGRSPVYVILLHAYLEQLLRLVGAGDPVVERGHDQQRSGIWSCEYKLQWT